MEARIFAGTGDGEMGKAPTAFDFINNRVGQIVTSVDLSTGLVTGPYKFIIDYTKVGHHFLYANGVIY